MNYSLNKRCFKKVVHKGRILPAKVETSVIFLPDVWNVCPTKLEWEGLSSLYGKKLKAKLANEPPPEEPKEETEEAEDEEVSQAEPTHWSKLDPKNMKVRVNYKEIRDPEWADDERQFIFYCICQLFDC